MEIVDCYALAKVQGTLSVSVVSLLYVSATCW